MRRSIFVISDLHLGGLLKSAATPIDLEMCTASARNRLVRFIDYTCRESAKQDVHLVINGDIVDFLAEENAVPFLQDDTFLLADSAFAGGSLFRFSRTFGDAAYNKGRS